MRLNNDHYFLMGKNLAFYLIALSLLAAWKIVDITLWLINNVNIEIGLK